LSLLAVELVGVIKLDSLES